MLLHQWDYLIIDAEPEQTEYITSVVKTSASDNPWEFHNTKVSVLRISITIQCNWKLRRTTTDFELELSDDWITVNKYLSLKNWREAYILWETIQSLGYDMPSCNTTIMNAIETLYPIQIPVPQVWTPSIPTT